MSFWRLNGGSAIVVGDTGEPINCDECPCEEVVQTSCCPQAIPHELVATVTNKTGTCTCLPDSVSLSYNGFAGGLHTWIGSYSQCGGCGMALSCDEASLTWLYGTASCDVGVTTVSVQCDPLVLVFDSNGTGLNCVGTFRVTITRVP